MRTWKKLFYDASGGKNAREQTLSQEGRNRPPSEVSSMVKSIVSERKDERGG